MSTSQKPSEKYSNAEEWVRWANRAHDAADRCDEIPERGEDFAESVQAKLESIIETIERTEHVTPAQKQAIENMEHGIERWLDR